MISELKKRQKQREKEAKKAEKAPQQSASNNSQKKADASAAVSTAADEEEALDPRQYFEARSRTIQKLRVSQNPSPYPHKFNPTLSISAFIETYASALQPGDHKEEVVLMLAGRIHNMRSSGSKIKFFDLHGEGLKIQVLAQAQYHKGIGTLLHIHFRFAIDRLFMLLFL
jgi:lysyl-tRNA synthetase, class II